MRPVVLCGAPAAFVLCAGVASGANLTGLVVNGTPQTELGWDTFPGAGVTSFVKQGPTFLNQGGDPLAIDVTARGTYAFDLRLNKGGGREMTNFRFDLFFDGAPDNSTPGIRVVAPRDSSGGTPPFTGDSTEVMGTNLLTLTSVRVSSFNPVDEVGEFTTGADGNIDYVGRFEFTVTEVPEPAGALWVCAATAGLLRVPRRRR
jgi:hypothetical protein